MTDRRVKRLCISPRTFLDLFTEGFHVPYSVDENAIPPDAQIVNVRHGWPDTIEVLIRSDSFPELHEGEEIPELVPWMSRPIPIAIA